MLTYPTHSDYYSLAINLTSRVFHFFCWVLFAEENDIFRINYVCVTFLLYCSGDVNVSFEDVIDHLTEYILI